MSKCVSCTALTEATEFICAECTRYVVLRGQFIRSVSEQKCSECGFVAECFDSLQIHLNSEHPRLTRMREKLADNDLVNHPPHYTSHPSGVECIQITEHFSFCLGNAIKYLWRAGSKGSRVEDLRKARWYIDRELERLCAQAAKLQK